VSDNPDPDPGPSTAQLLLALQPLLGELLGAPSISEIIRRPSEYRSSFELEELDVRLANGTTLALVFKNLSPAALSDKARGAKPGFLLDPEREIEVYRHVLSKAQLETARYYRSVAGEPNQYWLFLERVSGVELYQVGEIGVWRHVAKSLARLHARLAELRPSLDPAVLSRLIRHDTAYHRRWLERAEQFSPTVVRTAALRALASWHEIAIERVMAWPATLIHGEFYASNVLVSSPTTPGRVCPIDWEMAAVGPGLMDLAALVSGSWTTEQKRLLARDYFDSLPPALNCGHFDSLLQSLACAQLLLAVQWLGWSPTWAPPAAQAQDWLGEAQRAVRGMQQADL